MLIIDTEGPRAELSAEMSMEIDPEPIPHLRKLIDALIRRVGPSKSGAALAHLDQLPYYLRASYFWGDWVCRRMSALQETWSVPDDHPARLRAAADIDDPEAIWVTQTVLDDEAEPVFFAVDAYLAATRRAQNALVPYISKTFGVSLPESMSNLIKETLKRRSKLPEWLVELLRTYWSSSGSLVKRYRDESSHYAVLCSPLFLVRDDVTGNNYVSLLLPDKPYKSNTAVSYSKDSPQVVDSIHKSFLELFHLSYKVTWRLLMHLANDPSLSPGLTLRIKYGPSPPTWHAIHPDLFADHVRANRQNLDKWVHAQKVKRPLMRYDIRVAPDSDRKVVTVRGVAKSSAVPNSQTTDDPAAPPRSLDQDNSGTEGL